MKIIDKVIIFLKKFRLNKNKMIEENSLVENSYTDISKDKKEIVNKVLLNNRKIELNILQRKLNDNQIKVSDLNIFDVIDLIDVYKIQIARLKVNNNK